METILKYGVLFLVIAMSCVSGYAMIYTYGYFLGILGEISVTIFMVVGWSALFNHSDRRK
jgi:hypothetical protein